MAEWFRRRSVAPVYIGSNPIEHTNLLNMLAKDLKPGDYLWGIPIKDYDLGNPEINCYYIKKIINYTKDVLEIKEYNPMLDPHDTGLIVIPIDFNIDNLFFLYYGGACVWVYSTDGNKISNLYKNFISKKPNKIKLKCFCLFELKWNEYEI